MLVIGEVAKSRVAVERERAMSKGDRSCKVILAHLGQAQEEESVRTHERSLENQPEGASGKLLPQRQPPPPRPPATLGRRQV